jgi:hypothetical protein
MLAMAVALVRTRRLRDTLSFLLDIGGNTSLRDTLSAGNEVRGTFASLMENVKSR